MTPVTGHPDSCDCDACQFKAKLRTVQFGNVQPPAERLHEQRLDKDLPAYARLRANGLQPPSTRNAAELETRAHNQMEIEMGKLIAPPLLRQYQGEISEGMAIARDAGYGIDDIRGWKNQQTPA